MLRKFIKYSAYRACFGFRNLLDPFFRFQEVAILCYHSVGDSDFYTDVTSAVFESHLAYLKKCGHIFVSLADVVHWQAGKRALPRKAVALTFDDGYVDFETTALPILQKFRAPATLFVLGDEGASHSALGNDTPLLSSAALERVRANPLVEIGYHSKIHSNLARMSVEKLEEEISAPFHARFFAYPGGNHSPQAVAMVQKLGYLGACSIRADLVTKASNQYLLPRSVITRDMSQWEIALRATKAIEWYRLLTQTFKS